MTRNWNHVLQYTVEAVRIRTNGFHRPIRPLSQVPHVIMTDFIENYILISIQSL